MERAFTLRLTTIENNKLMGLKKLTGQKTDSGAIKCIIRTFEELDKRYKNEMELNKQLKNANANLKCKIDNFFCAFKDLQT